jgi:sodium transport system permease protein
MIFTIFKKELKDTLRDKRTLVMMLVIPTLIFPIILNIFVNVSASFNDDAKTKEITIALIEDEKNEIIKSFNTIPEEFGNKKFVIVKDTNEIIAKIQANEIQLGISTGTDVEAKMSKMEPVTINFFYDATEIGMDERAKSYFEFVNTSFKSKRFDELQISENETKPVISKLTNVASDKEVLGKLAGGILPYIFIAFGFLGCMYPAIDLFTGEKERGTIETLLTTPVHRWQILFGKMCVVVLSGLMASTCALFGLFLSIEVLDIVQVPEILAVIHEVLSLKFIIMLYALLFPLTVFFAGVMIPISIYAKSFKEAQSIITPLNVVMVLPAMIGFFPGVELNAITAAIPVVNVVLSTKDLIAGTLDIGLLSISFGVMVVLAIIAVFISYKQFDNESNVVLS